MVTQFNRLDVISNNLANLNTNGFKRDDVVVGDFKRLYEEKRDELPIANNTKEGAKFYNRMLNNVPHIVEEYTDHSVGNVIPTGNTLDLALKQSDLFFAVEKPDGSVGYTRDGSFSINKDGKLVTKEGLPVLPSNYFQSKQQITIPDGADVSVDKNGGMHYKVNGEDYKLEPDDQLMVAKFDDLKKLKKDGSNLYTADQQGLISEDTGTVMQGYLEKSNVNPIKEMVALIEVHRNVEMYQKIMSAQMDDLNGDAIQKLAARA
jgi:flagellar basal-body rod protein FlgG